MEYIYYYDFPIGKLGIAEENGAVTRITFGYVNGIPQQDTPLIQSTAKQLEEFFCGKRKEFDVPLNLKGTPFQQRVWNALQGVPYGKTASYAQIAQSVGNPKACRAVGMANNKNPVPVIIPCHRVVGSNNALVGYAGGVQIKKYLLDLEAAISKRDF